MGREMRSSLGFAIMVLICIPLMHAQQVANPNPGVLASPVNDRTVVRFFFHPLPSDKFPFPLVLRVSPVGDKRMDAGPILFEGRTVHISAAEMQDLINGMKSHITMGQQTRGIEVLGDYHMIPVTEAMDVVAIFSDGAARGVILKQNICKTLASLNPAIKTPRAHWEFQRFRVYYGCNVPGFEYNRYSD